MNSGVPGSATTSSKPAGVICLAMVRMTPGWLGANRILRAIVVLCLGLGGRNGGGGDGLVVGDTGGVAVARGVVGQARGAGAEHGLGAVAQPDLELARQDDHELPPRRRVPFAYPPPRPHAKPDLPRRQSLNPVAFLLDVDRLDAALAIRARVQPERSHGSLLGVVATGGMLAYEATHDRRDPRPDIAYALLAAPAPALRGLGQSGRAPAPARPRRPRPLPQLGLDGGGAARRVARDRARPARPRRQP